MKGLHRPICRSV